MGGSSEGCGALAAIRRACYHFPCGNRVDRACRAQRQAIARRRSRRARGKRMTASQYWLDQQAIERLAQHIPFETDPRTKAELVEMLRGLVLRTGSFIDREDFGFEAEQELRRLGLWERFGSA